MIKQGLKYFFLLSLIGCSGQKESTLDEPVIKQDLIKKYVDFFNQTDDEYVQNLVPNDQAYEWMSDNIPVFECPDSVLEQTYYYRWWTFRKHLKQTPDGYVWTEFITPVGHAGRYNTISCALGHHVNEGRWLHNQEYLDQYINYWFLKEKNFEDSKYYKFSSWAPYAIFERFKVNGDTAFVISLLDELVLDYEEWIEQKQLENGMFWQYDVRDGMEESISGSRVHQNPRPTINSYMYGNAQAIALLAKIAGKDNLVEEYEKKAEKIKSLIQENLWDREAGFFKSYTEGERLADVREAIGYIPWYFSLPEDNQEYAKAWEQINDPQGFDAPWGLTTAEIRHPKFRGKENGGCEWDGPVWPFATTQTLKGLSNLLNNYENHSMTKQDFYSKLKRYALSHQKNGKPYIGEYQDQDTGYWLKGDNPRSRYYNHSGFCDLIINDLVGIRPHVENVVQVSPLIPEDEWEWFSLDKVPYHGKMLTIVWDKTGEKYNLGKGLRLFVNGKLVAESNKLTTISATL